MTVLYFSIINVLCGADGDASFAPQANLVSTDLFVHMDESTLATHEIRTKSIQGQNNCMFVSDLLSF